jgi:hypothetical protein
MYFCANWGASECKLKDLAKEWQRRNKEDLNNLSYPHWNNVVVCDKLCKFCDNTLFLAMNDECFCCQEGKLKASFNPMNKNGFIHKYSYSCPECNISYYSYVKLK